MIAQNIVNSSRFERQHSTHLVDCPIFFLIPLEVLWVHLYNDIPIDDALPHDIESDKVSDNICQLWNRAEPLQILSDIRTEKSVRVFPAIPRQIFYHWSTIFRKYIITFPLHAPQFRSFCIRFWAFSPLLSTFTYR